MTPQYTRVAAIDDNEDHLQKIVWGLGKAGFCPVPFFFEDGKLENPPSVPIPWVRIVFTDIHLVGGGPNNEKVHAANIVRCLKKIVGAGPYALIFWSQYPADGQRMTQLIEETAPGSGLTRPIGYGAIDKNLVFKIAPGGASSAFDALKLRDLIVDSIKSLHTLAVAISWEDRVTRAAARTTNRLFSLVQSSAKPVDDWESLLAFLACESVGKARAVGSLAGALDSALLPLLEDQLDLIGAEPAMVDQDLERLQAIVAADGRRKCPKSIPVPALNASYLIDEATSEQDGKMWERGMVTQLGPGYVNSGDFVRAFGLDDAALLRQEFTCRDLTTDERRLAKLHIVELGPECDHVQGKMSTQRYLVALLVPASLFDACTLKKGDSIQYRNDSVVDVGQVRLKEASDADFHLLVSCRCYMTLAAKTSVNGRCRFRLRKSVLEELVHRYTSHSRRPGLMRWQVK